MTKVSSKEFREGLADIVNRVAYGHERIVICRRDKELVGMVPIADIEILEEIEEIENRLDIEAAKKILKDAEREGLLDWEDVKAELGIKTT